MIQTSVDETLLLTIQTKVTGYASQGDKRLSRRMPSLAIISQLDPCLGIGMPLRVFTLALFRKKSPKIPTLCRTTPFILGPCSGQMIKFTLSCLTQFTVFQRPENVPYLGLLN